MLRAEETLPDEPILISLREGFSQRKKAFEIPMERPARVDSAIAKYGVLNQAKLNAGEFQPDMGATCDRDAAAVRNDLHERLSRDGQLLDARAMRSSPEMPFQISLCEIARR